MITSRTNQIVKDIKSLLDKKNRDATNLYIIEGLKSVKEACQNNVSIKTLVFTENGSKLFGETTLTNILVSDDVFSCISDEKSPQGIIAVAKKWENTLISPKGSSLFLDGVMDPSNVGAIIRTAAASGYNDIYLADCADPYNPKAVRASMSGLFKVNIHIGNEKELIELIDKPIIVADMAGQDVFSFNTKEDFCLVIGNEAHGVSDYISNIAKYTVKIPMQNKMESLNAAVSAGILMYALKKK